MQMTQSDWLKMAFEKIDKTVFVMRGPSGAGKSHLARALVRKFAKTGRIPVLCSADYFFVDEDGAYNFDPRKLGEAHAQCLNRFIQAITYDGKGVQVVILDNTATRSWEYENYVALAKAHGYEVVITELVPTTIHDVTVLAERNVHGLTAEMICAQTLRFEPHEDAYTVEISTEPPAHITL